MDLFQPLQKYIYIYGIQSCRERCVIYIQANKINKSEWNRRKESENEMNKKEWMYDWERAKNLKITAKKLLLWIGFLVKKTNTENEQIKIET